MSPEIVPMVVVVVAALVAAVTDVWAFRIHNLLTLPLIASGSIYHGMAGTSGGLTGSVYGMLFGSSLLFIFYLLGGMGGGDVKLMAGIGAWLGMPLTVYVFAITSITAGVFALIMVIANSRLREVGVNMRIIVHRFVAVGRHLAAEDRVEAEVSRPDRRGRVVPYAAMMAVGVLTIALMYCWQSVWLGGNPTPAIAPTVNGGVR